MLEELVRDLNEWYRRPDNRNIRESDYLVLKNPETGYEISRYYPRDYAPSDFSFYRFKDLLKDMFSKHINYAEDFYGGAILSSYYGYSYELSNDDVIDLDNELVDYEYGTEKGAKLGRPRRSMKESRLNGSKMENRATKIFEEILNESVSRLNESLEDNWYIVSGSMEVILAKDETFIDLREALANGLENVGLGFASDYKAAGYIEHHTDMFGGDLKRFTSSPSRVYSNVVTTKGYDYRIYRGDDLAKVRVRKHR